MNESIALVVPSNRENHLVAFLAAWAPYLGEVRTVYVVEDGPERTFALPALAGTKVEHMCWSDPDRILGEHAWIIPRKTDCVRSIGYYQAWKDGHDIIVTLDDDCMPLPEEPNLFSEHASNLRSTGSRWTSTLDIMKPRGVPFYNTGSVPTAISHGLWLGVPDLDAVTQLASWEHGRSLRMREVEEMMQEIPVGQYYPMCGMNLAWHRDMTPAMYFLLMGQGQKFARFGDIWAGLFSKRIADHLGLRVVSGFPLVFHSRASNVWSNLVAEGPGVAVNETLWERVDAPILTGLTAAACYRELATAIELPDDEYWQKTRTAMMVWAELFE